MAAFNVRMLDYKPDGTLYWKDARRGVLAGSRAGHPSGRGYRAISYRGRLYREHRVVWEWHNGPIPHNLEVDHINGDRHDNRIENLRLATRSQNGCNHPVHRHNKLGIKNIRRRVRGNYVDYAGRVTKDGVVYRYTNADLGKVQAWVQRMRNALHGDFACHGTRVG